MASPRSTTLTLIAAYLGLFVGLIDSNAVNLALPAIRDGLGGGTSAAQWTADAYNVTFAAMLLTAGSAGDRFGRRRVLRIGLTVFVAASFVCAAAPTLPVLLVGRAAQGIGAALMLPQGLAIASAAFPDAAGRARATAAWAMAAASSAALGPVIGGILTDTTGWRFIFWLNVPVGAAAIAMSYRYLPESRDPQPGRIDIPGQLLAIASLGTLTVVLVEGHTMSAVVTTALAASVLGFGALFTWWQRRVPNPVLPGSLLGNRQLVLALGATFAMTFGTYGLLLVNSLAFQQQRGYSALATAVAFLPLPVTYLVLIPLVKALAEHTGPRIPMTAGLLAMGAGMALYGMVGPQAGLWVLEAAFVLTGAGLALNTGPAVGHAMTAVPVARAGLASGVVNLARLVGITVGIAVLGTLLAVYGVRTAVLTGAAVESIAAAAIFAGVHGRQRADRAATREVCHA